VSEYSPREIAAGGVFNVLTEEIISPREIGARAVFQVSTEEIISRGEPCEIAAGEVFNVLTEEIISWGESPRLPRSLTLNAAQDFPLTGTAW